MHFAWPVDIQQEEEGVSVSAPDVPGAFSWGATRAEALDRAADALVSMISAMIADGEAIPSPSEPAGRPIVHVSPLDAAKMALHAAKLERGLSNVDLGRMLGLDEKAIRRLIDPLHHSRIEKVEAALRALGKRLDVSVVEVAG